MSYVLRSKLPSTVVDVVKLYTGEGCWRNGKYIHIHRISSDDPRCVMLLKKPRIKQVKNEHNDHPIKGCAWFKLDNGKFVVINVRYTYVWIGHQTHIRGYVWEMHYNEKQTSIYLGN
jgi:hypothetical protein